MVPSCCGLYHICWKQQAHLDRDCRPDGLDKEAMKMDYMLLEAVAEDPDSEDKDCWKLVGKDPGRRFKKGLYW